MGAYDFSDTVNEVGNLASGIYKYDFDEDSSLVNPDFVSGWLHNNMGELNILTHSCYSGENPGMGDQEQSIYRQIFLRNFYRKLGRKILMGVSASPQSYTSSTSSSSTIVTSDWTELRDGDSTIRRRALLASPSEKVTASKEYGNYSKEADEELKRLLYKYNTTLGGPRQVAGKDASA